MLTFFSSHPTATTEIYTLSLHDALPISLRSDAEQRDQLTNFMVDVEELTRRFAAQLDNKTARSEEHTSELQSRPHLVCRLLLEKKKLIRLLSRRLPRCFHRAECQLS